MTDYVLDLCSSDDDDHGLGRNSVYFPAEVIDVDSVARMIPQQPQVVSLLDSDDDAEDNNNNNNNNHNHDNNNNDLDRKPAAKPTNQKPLARKRARDHPSSEIIDLQTSSPLHENRKRPPDIAAATLTQQLPIVRVITELEKPRTPLERVLEVFPDVDRDHAEKTLRACKNSLDVVLSVLAERAYPRNKHYTPITKSTNDLASSVVVKRNKVQQPKFDYMSSSSFTPSYIYIDDAIKQLRHEFPFLTLQGIKMFLYKHKNHYTMVQNEILDVLKGCSKKDGDVTTEEDEIQQYQHLKLAWTTKSPTPEQITKLGPQYCMKRIKRYPSPEIRDPILKDEVHFANLKLDEWMAAIWQRIKRNEARQRSEKSGSGVECGCCFDKVPIEEMVACRDEGHLFCTDCIQNYADTQVFSNGSLGVVKATGKPSCELQCCDSSGCQSGFQEEHLQKALSLKTLEKYHELVFRAIIEAAGIQEEMCSCPKCGFQADLPLNLTVFQCPVEDCRYESCRKCGKEAHVPLRCDEVVQKKREDEGRLKVEEAMAEAKIRKCPKCKTPFVKSDGCNKMVCRCGTKMCYICRQELKGVNPYAHFCQVPHCKHKTCNNCTLYSNAEEDDELAIREAGLTAAQNYREALKEKDQGGTEINIDVDGIMHPELRAGIAAGGSRGKLNQRERIARRERPHRI